MSPATAAQQEIETAVEKLRQAMISADRAILESLAADTLSYGHSNGHVEDKTEFVDKIANGHSVFTSITLFNQTISITGDTAVVRHHFDAHTNDGGNPNSIKLKILLVWQRQNNVWKLIARQAVRLVH